jgi:hypothetical protein
VIAVEAKARFIAPVVFFRGLGVQAAAEQMAEPIVGYLPPRQRVARITARLKEIAAIETEINYTIARLDF